MTRIRTAEQKLAHNRYIKDIWYPKNRQKHVASVKKNREKKKDFFLEYKKTLKCSKCQESDIDCLDFHHTNALEKDNSVSDLIRTGYSVERIWEEIKKCVVLCANCHRKEHKGNKHESMV